MVILSLGALCSNQAKALDFPQIPMPNISYKPCYFNGKIYTAVRHGEACPSYYTLYPRYGDAFEVPRTQQFVICYHAMVDTKTRRTIDSEIYDVLAPGGSCKFDSSNSTIMNKNLRNVHNHNHQKTAVYNEKLIDGLPLMTDDPEDPNCILSDPDAELRVGNRIL